MSRVIAYVLFGFSGILAIAVPAFLILGNQGTPVAMMPLNDSGDFLAGAFGPASLLVLAASFLLQQEELRLQRYELRQTRQTLDDQKMELQRSAEEAKRQNSLLEAQAIISDWKATQENVSADIFLMRLYMKSSGNFPLNMQSDHAYLNALMANFFENIIINQQFISFKLEHQGDDKSFGLTMNNFCQKISLFLSRARANKAIPMDVFEKSAEVRVYFALNRLFYDGNFLAR